MKTLAFILVFIFSSNLYSDEFEESAFVKLINKNGGTIPYPFANLLDSIGTDIRKYGNAVLIPNGRSLVKNKADMRDPRIIVNPQNLPGLENHELFIGFAPKHNALEVISFNKKTKEYDFFVIEDYEQGKKPKIVSNPSLCITCHQNKAPIFSRFPWSESLGDRSSHDMFANKKSDLFQKILEANKDRSEIEGINLKKIESNLVNNLKVLDDNVRNGNLKLAEKMICNEICTETDFSCKKILMKGLQDTTYRYWSDKNNFKAMGDIVSRISKLNLASSIIPNRSPYSNKGMRVLVNQKSSDMQYSFAEQILGKKETHDTTFFENAVMYTSDIGKLEVIENDKVFMDPTTKRPMNSTLMSRIGFLSKIKEPNELMREIYKNCPKDPNDHFDSKKKSEAEVDAIFANPSMLESLKKWPGNIFPMANSIQASVIGCSNQGSLEVIKIDQIEKINIGITNALIDRPVKLFNQYCAQCHGDKGFIPLPLESVEDMANYTPNFSETGVLIRLEKGIMPPTGARQPSKEEREFLIKYLKEYSSKK